MPRLTLEHYRAAAKKIQTLSYHRPTIALVLGSGLNNLADAVTNATVIPYKDIPHWPASTVHGHSGRLILGQLHGQTVLVMQGRAHLYEGYTPNEITFPIRVMYQIGIKTLLLTNAAGGVNTNYNAGDLMLIKDHINLPGMSGQNPLIGPNEDEFGPRFPDMTQAYDRDLRHLARQTAQQEQLTLHEGVYACVSGPSFETPTEIKFLRTIGADAVGMSTAPSVIVARHCGLRVLGISAITNATIDDPDSDLETSHEEVLEIGKQITPRLTRLLQNILPQLD
ncbi:MAG TPA: purine-nucleoside phosphorylase [Anaerolineae bacterium]|nr:purine-nucleoside phosphorylase [Anaerolineae bacterium]